MTLLIASDLDRTLIYSRTAVTLGPAPPQLRAVETIDGADVSFLSAQAAQLLQKLDPATFVPVTTRTVSQLTRITLPLESRYAVAANGGTILVDGRPDRQWADAVRLALKDAAPLRTVVDHLSRRADPAWMTKLREADGLFCYAVLDRAETPPEFLDDIARWAGERGWRTSLQGRKLYVVPVALTKSAAVAEIACRVGATRTIAAGDSLLDLDLLLAADAGMHPAHGELADSGWSAPHVRRTAQAGAAAGEEICSWFVHEAERVDLRSR